MSEGGIGMDLQLNNRIVLVTGGSEGLGKGIAKQYAKEGAIVWISSRNEEKLQAAQQEIIEQTGNEQIFYRVCNMRDGEAIQGLMNAIIAKHDRIDVLINNAGGPPSGPFLEMDDDAWQGAFEQNLLSAVRTCRLAIPYMQKQGAGRIVNLTSSSIKQAIDSLVLSNSIRPGVYGLTKTLAREFAKDNILVNTVGAGKIGTARMQSLNESRAEQTGVNLEEVENEMVASIPLGRYGTPEEFAQAVVFFGSFSNTYITGQAMLIDGGSVAAL